MILTESDLFPDNPQTTAQWVAKTLLKSQTAVDVFNTFVVPHPTMTWSEAVARFAPDPIPFGFEVFGDTDGIVYRLHNDPSNNPESDTYTDDLGTDWRRVGDSDNFPKVAEPLHGGAKGLVIKIEDSGTNEVRFKECLVRNPVTGNTVLLPATTIDLGTTHPLFTIDTGSHADGIQAIWLFYNATDDTTVLRSSASFYSPTFPAGYDYACMLGATLYHTSKHQVSMQRGNEFWYGETVPTLVTGFSSTAWTGVATDTTHETLPPVDLVDSILVGAYNVGTTNARELIIAPASSGGALQVHIPPKGSSPANDDRSRWSEFSDPQDNHFIPVNDSAPTNAFYAQVDAATGADITIALRAFRFNFA